MGVGCTHMRHLPRVGVEEQAPFRPITAEVSFLASFWPNQVIFGDKVATNIFYSLRDFQWVLEPVI